MKKYIPYIIIVVLVAVIAVGGTYIFMKGQLDNQNKENLDNKVGADDSTNKDKDKDTTPKKSGVELVSTKEEGQNIIQTFNAYMNGKTVTIKINYSYGKDHLVMDGTVDIGYIRGKFQNIEIVYKEFSSETQAKKDFSVSKIDQYLSTNNFKVIKGTDKKDYLLMATHMEDGAFLSDYLYVFNDELQLVSGDFSESECRDERGFILYSRGSGVQVKENPWYENTFNLVYEKNTDGWSAVRVKIENDKIYYLYSILNDDDSSLGILEERIYTINNNKLAYKVNKTYKIIQAAGGAC